MKVECPSCGKHNRFNGKPHCGECGASFVDMIFRKKPLVAASSAVAVTAAVLIGYDRHFREDNDRYPLAYEYDIVEFCSSSKGSMLSLNDARVKKTLCLCAVDGVAEYLSFDDFKEDQSAILPVLKKRIQECDAGTD